MRLYGVNGPAGLAETSPGKFKARQILGRSLLCAAVGCLLAGLPSTSVASRSDRAAGAQIFKDKGCEHCHGVNGVGTEKGPALTTIGKRMHKREIESQIRDGGKQMPPFGDMLSNDEMHKLVDYLAHNKKAAEIPAS
jgi:mono/diheme cytochrome c family protein